MISVLLIDDDEDEHFIFSDALQVFNGPIKFTYAQSALQSFGILEGVRPDIIFVDMNMPLMNGLECIGKLRGMRVEDVPVMVLYSTHIDERLRSSAEKAGADYCLQKTTSLDALVNKLRPFLEMIG